MAYTADPHHSRLEHHRIIPRDEADDDGLWLLVPEDNLDSTDHRCSTANRASAHTQPELDLWPRVMQRPPVTQRRADPWNKVRWSRYVVVVSLLILPLAGVLWTAGFDPDTWSGQPRLIPLLTFVFICWFVLAQLVVAHFTSYYIESRRPDWTATTTRCIADGIRFRNGLRKGLSRDQRRSVHPENG